MGGYHYCSMNAIIGQREALGYYSASSLKSGFFSFLVKADNSAIFSQVCVIES